MQDINLLIGGESRAAANAAIFERRTPASGEVATRAAAASVEDAHAAVEAAHTAFAD